MWAGHGESRLRTVTVLTTAFICGCSATFLKASQTAWYSGDSLTSFAVWLTSAASTEGGGEKVSEVAPEVVRRTI